jgi:hypothetical protein
MQTALAERDRMKAVGYFGVPKIRALFETTYVVGLRKAGVQEE